MEAFANQDGTCVPVAQKIANCLSYIDANTCKHCRPGYYRTSEGNCHEIPIQNCYEAKDASHCSVCKPGIQAHNGQCDVRDVCPRRNCELCGVYGRKTVCTKCRKGFTLVARTLASGRKVSVCVRQRKYFKNCAYLNQFNLRRCAVCEPGFFWSRGKCLPSQAYEFKNSAGRFSAFLLIALALIMLS